MTHLKKAPTTHDAQMQLAMEQSALHRARLALARWSSGNTRIELQLEKILRPSRQANWHDLAQANFIAWLNLGGFAADTSTETLQSTPNATRPSETEISRTHENLAQHIPA